MLFLGGSCRPADKAGLNCSRLLQIETSQRDGLLLQIEIQSTPTNPRRSSAGSLILVTFVSFLLFVWLLILYFNFSATKSKPAAKPAGQKRKAAKRNPWESGSDSDVSIGSFGSNDSAMDFVPKKTEKRAARNSK